LTTHAIDAAGLPQGAPQGVPEALRQTMIDSQLRTVGVIDAMVLAAMAAVPREAFVPARLRGLAYADAALEVAPGRWLLEPMVLALLLQNARVGAGDRVLVVGAASGYSAAVLRHIGASVTAIESDPALLAAAQAAGVDVIAAPLAAGWPAAAPYDVVLFEGAIEVLPAAIAAQLAPGGRVAAVVREGGIGRASAGPVIGTPGDRTGGPRIGGLPFLEVAAKPLPGFAAAREFAF
jgi:protein-L-isoaspartate(D-aspartate) O-methyltransferase